LEQNDLCTQLAAILGGDARQEDNVCTVTIRRTNMNATIAKHPMQAVNHIFYFGAPDRDGNTLITGELALLDDEVPKTVDRVTTTGIIVSAVHNHWIYDDPKLMYIHLETYTNPVTFARMMAPIAKDLK